MSPALLPANVLTDVVLISIIWLVMEAVLYNCIVKAFNRIATNPKHIALTHSVISSFVSASLFTACV